MNLKYVFNPKSIAVIGASTQPGSVGNDLVKNLVYQGFKGKIYPVNPKTKKLYNLRCYPSVLAIKKQVQLIIVAVPAPVVLGVIKEAAAKKVKAAVVITAGFKEVGHKDLESEIGKICKEN
ncbi:MAG: CoA-binding protein, partial [bacterium]